MAFYPIFTKLFYRCEVKNVKNLKKTLKKFFRKISSTGMQHFLGWKYFKKPRLFVSLHLPPDVSPDWVAWVAGLWDLLKIGIIIRWELDWQSRIRGFKSHQLNNSKPDVCTCNLLKELLSYYFLLKILLCNNFFNKREIGQVRKLKKTLFFLNN